MVTELLCINYRDKRALYFNLARVSQGKNYSEIATEYNSADVSISQPVQRLKVLSGAS